MKTLLDIKTEIAAIQEAGADLKKVTYADKTKERKRKKAIQRDMEDFELNDPNWLGDSSIMALFAHKLTHEANTNLETE